MQQKIDAHRGMFRVLEQFADWRLFDHLAATLAKVLIVTEGKPRVRERILRGNAETLLAPRA